MSVSRPGRDHEVNVVSGVWRYLGQRVLLALLLIYLVSSGALLLAHLAPGDLTSDLVVEGASAETIARARARAGLDRPFLSQYVGWLTNVLRLDLGMSLRYGRPVTELLAERAGNTAVLGACPSNRLLGLHRIT